MSYRLFITFMFWLNLTLLVGFILGEAPVGYVIFYAACGAFWYWRLKTWRDESKGSKLDR